MHELSVTENILAIANRHAEQAGAQRVTQVNITIGRLSSIVDDSVQFYWDILSKETLCERARLVFTRLPAKLHCTDCAADFEMGAELAPCPRCGSMALKVESGEEFYVDSILVEK